MAIVLEGGDVAPGDTITSTPPPGPPVPGQVLGCRPAARSWSVTAW